jgi:tRNA 2-thiouridine synthesizing protein E
MYPNMQIITLLVNGKEIKTCSEGYIVNLDEWSEDFVHALASREQLELTDEHWQVIHFIREYHEKNSIQPNVREMIKHFRKQWGAEKGSNRYLHDIFPRGGPQKQGNRLAGIRRTKGEH